MPQRPAADAAPRRTTVPVLGTPIDAIDAAEAVRRIRSWARERDSRSVCICNVHSVVTATRDPEFAAALADADMATPDGAPVAWFMRRVGWPGQRRVSGPDLMWDLCRDAGPDEGMFLLGSTDETLARLRARLEAEFPSLRICGSFSPPFRPPTEEEDERLVRQIDESGAGIVWVSLGCPKQELWMARHRGRIRAVMVGVGAAFDFHAGTVRRAPRWVRDAGFEWLHRLLSEPRRLWRRYLVTNSLFVWRVVRHFVVGTAPAAPSRGAGGDR